MCDAAILPPFLFATYFRYMFCEDDTGNRGSVRIGWRIFGVLGSFFLHSPRKKVGKYTFHYMFFNYVVNRNIEDDCIQNGREVKLS